MKRLKIRNVSKWNVIIAIMAGLLFFTLSYWSNKEFYSLQAATEQYIVCEKNAKDLQEGSHYLTEQVRLFVMTEEEKYLNNYFYEMTEVRRRERAIESLQQYFAGTAVLTSLQSAMDASNELIKTEYYAMRLVLEANNVDPINWPESLRGIALSDPDETLSAEEKILMAQQLVSNDDYETTCNRINTQVTSCTNNLIQKIRNRQGRSTTIFSDMYRKLEIGVAVLVIMMLIMSLIVRKLIVVPLMNCIHSIEHGGTFPVAGADELQLLAETYNKVYEENQEAQMLIRHKAEHDPLTDLLNRGSFDKILKIYEEDNAPFALIIVDVDSFKTINDTYGHAEGDEILKKVSQLLVNAFRSIDHVCRIGGDEFAIIMVEMTSDLQYTIQEKIDAVNQMLAEPDDKLPAVSLSVGVAFSDREHPTGTIFEDADKALYVRKYNGKSGCSFYE